MKVILKIILTIIVMALGAFFESIITNYINVADDFISITALIMSFVIILIVAYLIYFIHNPKEQTIIKNNNENE